MTLKNRCHYLILAFIVAFSVIPVATRNIIPYDMIENLYWGKELQLGYAKHPPLFAWISYFFYRIFFSCAESLYVLTQLNLLLGFYFIFKTSRLIFKDETKSYSAVLIFMASICAVFGNEKFNANTILMSLFPMMFYFFIRWLKFNKKRDSFALGMALALTFIGKYFALLYIGCMGLFLISHSESRRLLKTSTPYIVFTVFFICISWHLLWIYNSDFITIKYSLDKSVNAEKNFFSCLNFLLMQFLFFSTSLWAFKYSYSGKMNFLPRKNQEFSLEEKFIIFITLIPNLLLFIISLATGMRIGSFWGVNMLMMLGIYLLIINKNEFNCDRLFVFVQHILFFFAVALFIKLGIARFFLRELDPTNAINIRQISALIDRDWQNCFGNQNMTVLKTDKATAALHIYLKDSPSSYDVKHCDQFRIYDKYPQNTRVVATFLCDRCCNDIKYFRDFYKKDILFDNMIDVIGHYVVYYAFLNVRDNQKGEK